MTPDRFALLEDAFHRVSEAVRGGGSPEAVLDDVCGEDLELRAEVKALLEADADVEAAIAPGLGELLSASGIVEALGRGGGAGPASNPGKRLGKYTLLELIGEGGFGAVYRATQSSPSREVAVKVLDRWLSSASSVARFKYESEALARMEHSNIARIFEADISDGTAYIAMELVRGAPITRYCDEQRLPVAARLALFIDVCEAVHHAHIKGVIHRDLKPENLLVAVVDGKPVVKVIDFGIAKAAGAGDARAGLTLKDERIGTPAYMSPEQLVPGSTVDTRTDVYSLGVVLYELLTGVLPFPEAASSAMPGSEIRRLVGSNGPARPSDVAGIGRKADEHARARCSRRRVDTVRALGVLLRGDLDAITFKALAEDRVRRYQSAADLANDVRRHLGRQPVTARAPTAFYMFGRLARRHRASVLAAGAVAGAVLVGGVIVVWKWQTATRAEGLVRRSNYLATIFGVNERLLSGSNAWQERRLDSLPVDLRGWEWGYLCARTDQSRRVLAYEHPERVTSVAVSGDGSTLISGCEDGVARIVDLRSGSVVRSLSRQAKGVWGVAISPDGSLVACAGGEASITLWSTSSGELIRRWTPQDPRGLSSSVAYSVAFSPDGRMVGAGYGDQYAVPKYGGIGVYSVGAEAPVFESPNAHASAVNSVAFSPDGRLLVSASDDKTVRAWSTETWAQTGDPMAFEASLNAVAFSPDGATLGAAAEDGEVFLVDVASRERTQTLRVPRESGPTGRMHALVFSADGSLVGAGVQDRSIRVWWVADGRLRSTLLGHDGAVYGLARAGPRVYSASRDRTVREWDLSAAPNPCAIKVGTRRVTALEFGAENRLFVASEEGILAVLTEERGHEIHSIARTEKPISWIAVAPDGRHAAVRVEFGDVWSWDADDEGGGLRRLGQFADHASFATGLAQDAGVLWVTAGGGVFESIVMGRTEQHGLGSRATLKPGEECIRTGRTDRGAMAIVRQGDSDLYRCCAEGSDRGTRLDCRGSWGSPTASTMSPSGLRVAFALDDGPIRVFDSIGGNVLADLESHSDRVVGLAFSPDDRRLASMSFDGVVKVWDVDQGAELLTLHRPSDTPSDLRSLGSNLRPLAFSRDGTLLAGGFFDGTVRVWDSVPMRERASSETAP